MEKGAQAAGQEDFGRGIFGQPRDQFAARPIVPQYSPELIAASVDLPKAGGGSSTSTRGSNSVNACSARADIEVPAKIAPPAKAPLVETRSTVIALPKSSTMAAQAFGTEPIHSHCVDQTIQPHAVGTWQIDLERQVGGRQQLHARYATRLKPCDQPRGCGPVDAGDRPGIAGRFAGRKLSSSASVQSTSTETARCGCGNGSARGRSKSPSLIRLLPTSTATSGKQLVLGMQLSFSEVKNRLHRRRSPFGLECKTSVADQSAA